MTRFSKGDKTAIVITIIIWTSLIIYSRIRRGELIKSPAFTKGVIIGRSKGAKGSNYIDFTFYANHKMYKNSTDVLGFCVDCKDDCCEIGDSVIVRFQKEDPMNCELLHKLPEDISN